MVGLVPRWGVAGEGSGCGGERERASRDIHFGLLRLTGVLTCHRHFARSLEALVALRMAGVEIVPVVVANNRGTVALWAGDLEGSERSLTAAMHVDLDELAIPQLNATSDVWVPRTLSRP